MHPTLRGALWPLLLIGTTVSILALAILAFGQRQNPGEALLTLWRGAFGSLDAATDTASRAAILIFYALGVVLSFRAGIFNIGTEGQSRMGAIVAAAIAVNGPGRTLASVPFLGIPLVLLFGAIVGSCWSLIAGVLRRWRGVPEVIGTLMLNFIALALARYLLSDPALLRESRGVISQSDVIPAGLQLQSWGATEFHTGILLVLPLLAWANVYLFHTPSGFSLRATGLNPAAAKTCGINVAAVELKTFAMAGALAGFAGAMGVLVRYRLDKAPYPSDDYGFMAIAVALVADLKPLWTLPAALLFAALEVGTGSMERNAGVSHEVVYLVEGLIILAVLIRHVASSRSRASEGSAAAKAGV